MAIIKRGGAKGLGRNGLRRSGRLGQTAVLALLVLGAGYWALRDSLHDQALAGAAFGARTVCSCRYVGGRDMASCKGDFEPGMSAVFVSEDEDEQEITAWVPLLASQSARFVPGFGCLLDGWQG